MDNYPTSPNNFPSDPDIPGQLPIVPPQKSKKPLIITLLVVVLLAVAGGGAYLYLAAQNNTPKEASATPTTTPTPKPQTADSVVAALKKLQFQGTVQQVAKTTATDGETDKNVVVYAVPSYTAERRKYANDPEQSSGTGTSGTPAAVAADYTAMVAYLTDHGFKDQKLKQTVSDPTVVHNDLYKSDSIVCGVVLYDLSKSTVTSQKSQDSTTSIGCADLASYDKVATSLDPIYKAMSSNQAWVITASSDLTLYLSHLKVNDGASGSKNATVAVSYVGAPFGAGQAYIYQPAGKDWAYLDMNQNELDCSKVVTADQKQAFAGQKCMDYTTQKETTVAAS